jgi:hypothetical protein
MQSDQRRRVSKVIKEPHQSLLRGESYDPTKALRAGTTAIKDGSMEQQLVADYRERGLSLTETTMLINRWCVRNGRKSIRYGIEKDEWEEERWKVEIRKSSAFSGCVSIKELVKHIVLETQKCFKNTRHSDAYHFYHDALTQLTNEETVKWMKETKVPGETHTIDQRWIKPERGLNDEFGKRCGDVQLATHLNRCHWTTPSIKMCTRPCAPMLQYPLPRWLRINMTPASSPRQPRN